MSNQYNVRAQVNLGGRDRKLIKLMWHPDYSYRCPYVCLYVSDISSWNQNFMEKKLTEEKKSIWKDGWKKNWNSIPAKEKVSRQLATSFFFLC
jgi:hypothetical protein